MAPVKKQQFELQPTYLKAWREKAGLDQEDAAAALDISRTLLSKIENAKSPYSQRLLEKASGIYGARPAQLIGCDPHGDTEDWALWLKVADASEEERRQILSYIKFVLKNP